MNGYDTSDFTELIFSVSELNLANNTIIRKVSSHEVMSALNQPNIVQGLQQKHSIENLSQKCGYTDDQVCDLGLILKLQDRLKYNFYF